MNVIQQLSVLVEETRDTVISKISKTEYAHRQPEFTRLFQTILTRFEHMGAIIEGADKAKPLSPITKFMGKSINRQKSITLKDLGNEDEVKEKFLADRDKLYSNIRSFSPEVILNSYTIPEHQIILRAVAKKAGVQGYAERLLNIAFIEEIQAAINARENIERQQKRIDQQLGGNEKHHEMTVDEFQALSDDDKLQMMEKFETNAEIFVTLSDKIEEGHIVVAPELLLLLKVETDDNGKGADKSSPKILTQEDIAGDIELQRLGAKPGMELYYNKNKKAVRKPK